MRARLATVCVLFGLAGPVLAGGIGLPESLPDTSFTLAGKFPVQIHGSLSAGYLQTTDNDVYGIKTDDGTFQYNEFTLNATIALTDSLTIGAQGLSRDLGPFGNNDLMLDWGYVDYNFNEAIGIRAGRVKLALGIYGDMWDIDVARTGALLPLSTYLPFFRDMYSFCDGAQVYGNLSLGPGGELSYHAFVGEQRLECDGTTPGYYLSVNSMGALEAVGHYKMHEMYGGRVTWSTPLDGLSLSGSLLYSDRVSLDLETIAPFPGFPGTFVAYDYTSWYLGGEYQWNDWALSCELMKLEFAADTEVPAFFLNDEDKINMGGVNVQLNRYWNERLETAIGYGAFYENWRERWSVGDGGGREDAYVAAKVSVTDYLTVKGEVHYMEGLHGADALNNPNGREDQYWLFVFKGTLSF